MVMVRSVLWVAASPKYRHLLRSMELADLWTTDGHKSLNTPFECGYAFGANADAHRGAFPQRTSYTGDSGAAQLAQSSTSRHTAIAPRPFRISVDLVACVADDGAGGAHMRPRACAGDSDSTGNASRLGAYDQPGVRSFLDPRALGEAFFGGNT
jgi:hypothetical protein